MTQTPQLALAGLLAYADIIGGILGIIGSAILAQPLLSEIVDRKHWDQLSDFIRRHNASGPKTDEERLAEQGIRDHLLNSRLGRSQRHRKVTLFGLAVLFAAFVFTTLAAVERRYERAPSRTQRQTSIPEQLGLIDEKGTFPTAPFSATLAPTLAGLQQATLPKLD